ncbi:hypothetical protein NQ317_009913 [Molorchus minor]|uniref:PDZ domain-containing protein n=1 Tax=Molorchus minor TaxID=1323400 RepID=A0ABQ9K847_9CUCU|nr:hypothetical protein NQ317_009913 [Molorchus minor]
MSSINYNDSVKSSIVIPPLSINTSSNLPKYSPAFKRRSIQVYPIIDRTENCDYVSNAEVIKYCDKTSSRVNKSNDDDVNPPKSLESISSPTRSDCSFDYVSSTKKYIREPNDSFQKSHVNKEDESDNDSAVSSSQSSYNSRFSPPPSPTRSCELNHYKSKLEDDDKLNSQNRLLKPSSVEAINRKNILASAKCRSGKDLKIGSPIIRRKQEDNQVCEQREEPNMRTKEESVTIVKENQKIVDKVSRPYASVPFITTYTECNTIQKPPAKIVEIVKNGIEDAKENKLNKDLYSSSSIFSRRSKPINVKALKENFENFGSAPPPLPQQVPLYKPPVSSRNVKAEIAKTETKINNIEETVVKRKVEKAEIKQIEAKPRKSLELKDELKAKETRVIELSLESLGGNLGITLTGGTDYDSKNVTEPVTDFSIEIEEGEETVPFSTNTMGRRSSSVSVLSEPKSLTSDVPMKKATNVISYVKDGAGHGFSIEGGKDSPQGDVPLTVRKIFTGGAADKCGELKTGDEILFINDICFTNLSRIEAWTMMKKIPDGNVNIHIFR